jgi:peptidyl-prolyl cis-trans isomerase SurA
MFRFFLPAIFLFLSSLLPAATVVEEVLAKVGNEIITRSDYQKEEQRLYEELGRRYQGEELEKQFAEQRSSLLEFMINQMLLDQRAKELEINVDEEVAAAVRRLREENQIPDEQALDAALQKEGSSIATLKYDFKKRIIQQKILWNYVQGKVTITEDEIRKYYEDHKKEMVSEPGVKISRYSVSDDIEDKDKLKEEATSMLTELRSGKPLTKENYPHLKTEEPVEFANSELNPTFVKVLDETEVGGYSEPIETSTGWIVLQLHEKHGSEPVPFDQARQKIYSFLVQERAEKYRKTFLEDLRKQSYVMIKQKPA